MRAIFTATNTEFARDMLFELKWGPLVGKNLLSWQNTMVIASPSLVEQRNSKGEVTSVELSVIMPIERFEESETNEKEMHFQLVIEDNAGNRSRIVENHLKTQEIQQLLEEKSAQEKK